jgi:hypothetical protein
MVEEALEARPEKHDARELHQVKYAVVIEVPHYATARSASVAAVVRSVA